MNQEQLERIAYRAQAAKEADIMLTISPDAVLELIDNLRTSVELTAIREGQLQFELKEVEQLQAEVKRLKDKANRFLDSLENEGLFQDRDEYVALREE